MDDDMDFDAAELDAASNEIPDPDDETLLIDFETTPDITVENECNNNVTSSVWKDFGVLKKGGRILQSMQKRIFCKLCFVNKTLKRYFLL